jgi:hypothetical protein
MTDQIEKFKKYLLNERDDAKKNRERYRPVDDEEYDFYEGRYMAFAEAYGAFLTAFPPEKTMTNEDAIKWLEQAAKYFEKRPTNGEDSAHWSNVYNAESARKIAELLKEKTK